MARARIAPALLAAALVAAPSGAARAAVADLVVAVLYFDNNTGKADYDVLKKGLADMMVTDLSSVAGLQVVERDKLEALLGELSLQRSSYFDAKTAQRIGRGIGATHAVTGTIAAVEPDMRLDVRLVEVATARVVMADKVVGRADRFFTLQQALADKFVEGLKVGRAGGVSTDNAVQDLGVLMGYSKAVDAADRGDLEAAKKQMAGVVARAPSFKLAQERYADLLRRLLLLRKRRKALLSEEERALFARAEAFLKGRDLRALDTKEAYRYLGYRLVLTKRHALSAARRLGLRSVPDLIGAFGTPRRAPAGEERAVLDDMAAYVDALEALAADVHTVQQAEAGRRRDSVGFLIDDQDREAARALNLTFAMLPWSPATAFAVQRAAARVLALGQSGLMDEQGFVVQPTLASRQPTQAARALRLLDEALAGVRAWKADDRDRRTQEIATEVLYGEVLVALGRKGQGVARWQALLERFPTYEKYAEIEKRIEDALGVSEEARRAEEQQRRFDQALAACDMAAVGTTAMQVIQARVKRSGEAGLVAVADAVQGRCDGTPNAAMFRSSVLMSAATIANMHGFCDVVRDMVGRLRREAAYPAGTVDTMADAFRQRCP